MGDIEHAVIERYACPECNGHTPSAGLPHAIDCSRPSREKVEYVRADAYRGAVNALRSIAFSDSEAYPPDASELRTRAFTALKALQGGQQ